MLTARLALAGCLLFAPSLIAQKVRVEVSAPPQRAWGEQAPTVSSAGLLTDAAMRDLLSNGFPARLHYRLERWKSGRWFDDLQAASEWDVILKYDVLSKRYQAARVVNQKAHALGDYATLEDAASAAEAPSQTTISLPR